MNWQPIDTAPKDGTRVLILCPGKRIAVVAWLGGWYIAAPAAGMEDFPAEVHWPEDMPTHWMPLDKLKEAAP